MIINAMNDKCLGSVSDQNYLPIVLLSGERNMSEITLRSVDLSWKRIVWHNFG